MERGRKRFKKNSRKNYIGKKYLISGKVKTLFIPKKKKKKEWSINKGISFGK